MALPGGTIAIEQIHPSMNFGRLEPNRSKNLAIWHPEFFKIGKTPQADVELLGHFGGFYAFPYGFKVIHLERVDHKLLAIKH
jgi:hypothetical protein